MLIELGVLTAMYLGLVWIMNTKQRTEIHIVSQPALKLRVETQKQKSPPTGILAIPIAPVSSRSGAHPPAFKRSLMLCWPAPPMRDLREVLRTVLEASIDERQRMGTRQTGPERLEQQQGDSTPGGP
jgi:hypothetical protein